MPHSHAQQAREILAHAELIFDEDAVQAGVDRVAADLNARFDHADSEAYPLVLGVMGGAVVFAGQLLTRLKFPLEFDYIHVTRYGYWRNLGSIWAIPPK